MRSKLLFFIIMAAFSSSLTAQSLESGWKQELSEELSLFGHRNWILVVDAAYPQQSKPAIKTIVTGEDQLDVVKEVFTAVKQASHVDPVIYLDKEIDFVPEEEAKGITMYKRKLEEIFEGVRINKELHEELIKTVDNTANTFNILVLKTNLTIPYTSVFFRLDCGYWNEEQENNMRRLMK